MTDVPNAIPLESFSARDLLELLQELPPHELGNPVYVSTCCDYNRATFAKTDSGAFVIEGTK